MPKFLSAVFILLCIAGQKSYAQPPTIDVPQYTIIIDRSGTFREDAFSYNYKYGANSGTCLQDPPPYGSYPDFIYRSPNMKGWCYVQDANCGCRSGDELNIKLYNGTTQIATNVPPINLAALIKGESFSKSDTINLYQPDFNVTSITSTIVNSEVMGYNYYYYDPRQNSFDIDCHTSASPYNTLIAPFTDQLIRGSNTKYSCYTRVRVIPNLDPTFNLPSHDRIILKAKDGKTSGSNKSYFWQFQDPITGVWSNVPAGHTSGTDGNILEISGVDLFGAGYIDRLHSTVNFRVRRSIYQDYSKVVPFTLRLSSPHIINAVPTDLNCYERNEGSLKINFDRELLTGEKLNIFLYDTVNRVNFSAFNLTKLNADKSFTWPNELRAGTYLVTLIGKYAKGLEYDLYVPTRVDTQKKYLALNSVNFEDGFTTPEVDDFTAATDFTSSAQPTYTGALNHFTFQEVKQPKQIQFIAQVNNHVLCKGNASGALTVAANGGMGNYKYSLKLKDSSSYSAWTNFQNNNFLYLNYYPAIQFAGWAVEQKISNLKAGIYSIRVRDNVDCYRKDLLGEEVTLTIEIKEPAKGLTVDLFELSPITSADSANGKIKLQISGGTPYATSNAETTGYPYRIQWTDSAGKPLTGFTQTFIKDTFETATGKLADGTYIFKLYDKSYKQEGPDTLGCYLKLVIPVKKPKPLLVTISRFHHGVYHQVACYGDTSGSLIALPQGGIPLSGGGYLFKWFKQTPEGNTALTSKDSIINNLRAGTYLVEVTDRYGNKKLSQPFIVTQPALMQLQFITTPATCYSSFNGSMAVMVTGGTPFADTSKPYAYEWSNGGKTGTVNKVAGGNYLVVVRDSMNCITKDTVSVTTPVRVVASYTVKPVGCYDVHNGEIAVTVTGGNAPYTYQWSNGATTATATNLSPGMYWYKVVDANGCFDGDSLIELDKPDTLLLNLGANRNICTGQTVHLDAFIPSVQPFTYAWTSSNGFTASTARVAVKQEGDYYVVANNSRGCTMRDTISLSAINSSINTDFVVSTQAYVNESVHLVNISKPTTDSVKWIIPSIGNTITVLQQNNNKCELRFADTGRYLITMRAYYASGCIEDSTKAVHVILRDGSIVQGNQANAYLKKFTVYPNPSNGNFTVGLEFSEITRAKLRLINTLDNFVVDEREASGSKTYTLSYTIGGVTPGAIYMLVIDTAKGSFVYKVAIAK